MVSQECLEGLSELDDRYDIIGDFGDARRLGKVGNAYGVYLFIDNYTRIDESVHYADEMHSFTIIKPI